MWFPVLAVLDLSVSHLVTALIILVIGIIIFVAVWNLIKGYLGQFAGLVMAFAIIILILIIAGVFGVFSP